MAVSVPMMAWFTCASQDCHSEASVSTCLLHVLTLHLSAHCLRIMGNLQCTRNSHAVIPGATLPPRCQWDGQLSWALGVRDIQPSPWVHAPRLGFRTDQRAALPAIHREQLGLAALGHWYQKELGQLLGPVSHLQTFSRSRS